MNLAILSKFLSFLAILITVFNLYLLIILKKITSTELTFYALYNAIAGASLVINHYNSEVN